MRNIVYLLLMAMVFQIPWEDLVFFGSFGTLIRAIGIGAAFLGIIAILITGRVRGLLFIHYLMILFISYAALSLVWTQDAESTIGKSITYLQLLAFTWLIWEFAPDEFRQRLLMQTYIWGCILALLLQFLGMRSYVAWSAEQERYSAGAMNSNELGTTFLMSIPMAIYCALEPKANRLMRIAYLLYCPVCALGILLTGSRGAFIGECVMALMIGVVFLFKRPVFVISFGLVAGAAFFFLFTRFMPESTWDRLANTYEEYKTGNWSGRLAIYESGLVVFQQYPILGTGNGTFAYVIGRAGVKTAGATAHNAYLNLMVELGLVGLILFLFIIIAAGLYTLKMPFREKYTWLIILASWGLCTFAGTFEAKKLIWYILAMIACQYAIITGKRVVKKRGEPVQAIGAGTQALLRPR